MKNEYKEKWHNMIFVDGSNSDTIATVKVWIDHDYFELFSIQKGASEEDIKEIIEWNAGYWLYDSEVNEPETLRQKKDEFCRISISYADDSRGNKEFYFRWNKKDYKEWNTKSKNKRRKKMNTQEYLETLKPLEEDAVNTFQAGKKPTQTQLRARFAALLAKEIINGEFDELITDLCIDSDLEGIRQCSQCGQLMLDGYVAGEKHYCSKKCLHKNYTAKDWKKMSAADPDENYYTDWIEE